MDMSLVAAVMAQQAGALQQQIATTTLKSNLDMQKSTVLTLLGGAQQSLANVGPGVGSNLNISA
jgi:putative motility protein YjfB-like